MPVQEVRDELFDRVVTENGNFLARSWPSKSY